MNAQPERILVVESDHSISELVVNQALTPMGYHVQLVTDASTAIEEAVRILPDVILVDLNLPGLSGKDLMVALSSQGLDIPVIVLSSQVKEGDIIGAFRLGAVDFISWPTGEAEVVSVVERVLDRVRSRRAKDLQLSQLNRTKEELQHRLRDLSTINAMGKAVTSITDLGTLMEKLVEGAVFISEADIGWLLLKDEKSKNFVVSAGRNLPASVNLTMNQPWDDGLSSLVAQSRESLAIHGDALKRFGISMLGRSALVSPVKIQNEVQALLIMVRKSNEPFSKNSQALMNTVADYASVAIINARLVHTLNDRIKSSQRSLAYAQLSERISREVMVQAASELRLSATEIRAGYERIKAKRSDRIDNEWLTALNLIHSALEMAKVILSSVSLPLPTSTTKARVLHDLNDMARRIAQRCQPFIQPRRISFQVEPSPFPLKIPANDEHIIIAIEGLVANIIHNADRGSVVRMQLTRTGENLAQLTIQSLRREMPKRPVDLDFQETPGDEIMKENEENQADRIAFPLGISLNLVQDILKAYNGRTWIESEVGKGSVFIVQLPCS